MSNLTNQKLSSLPQRLTLELAAAEVGLSGLSEPAQLHALLQFHRNNGLLFKSNKQLDCNVQLTTNGVDEVIEPDGAIRLMSGGKTTPLTATHNTITLGDAYLSNQSIIGTMTFFIDEIEYYCVDYTEMFIETLAFKLADIFIDKNDLEAFLKAGTSEIPPYSDPRSEYYAPELELAIEIHQEIRIKKTGSLYRNMEDKVKIWLDRNRPNEKNSAAKVRRLAIIIGNDKKNT